FAAVDILPALQYLIEDFGSEDVKLAGVTEVPFPLQVMVSKEHAGLLPLINRAIVSISPEERAAIHRKWMVRDVISSPDYAWLWLVLAAVLLPMAFILFWNRRMAREIVRRQQVESALNESRDQLTRVLQAGNLGFWDWRPLSDELFTNDIFLTMLGHEVDAFPQTTERWATLVHPDDLEPTLGILQAFIDGEDGDYRSEHRMRTADGQWKWILDVGRVIERNAEGKAERFVGVHIDINERKQMEQELKGAIATAEEMTQEAERATQVKSAFLANMSHEIRTPMNAIIGMSELSLEGSLAPRERNFVTKVHQSAKSLLGIINSILDFSKIEADKLELEIVDFPLQAVLDNLNNLIGYRAEEQGLALNIEIDPQVPPVLRGDPLRLGQILINLGNNAVKFTQQGEITVKVNLDEQNGEHVVLHFGVCDTGIGMTQEQQQRVFQSFDQADSSISRQYGGTGLGLAISKNLVQIMGGTIWAESEMGRGSNFHFVLPLEIGDTGLLQQQAEDEVEQVAQLRGAKVLLVEDNEFNQELAAELLANKGMFVTTAWNGREALEVLQTEQFDIVLMDLQMPVMGGYEATREIRKQARLKELPVIALTANVMAGERDKAKSAGMNDLIGKPLDVSEMFATMVRWIKMDHLSKQQTGLKIDPEKDREKDGTALIGDSSGEFDVLVGINIEKGLAVTDNDSQLYRRILMMFFDEHREFAKEFRFAQQDGDPQAAARAAHTLKGVAASIGATAVRQAADGLEHVCLQNGTDEIIDSALQQVIGELDPVMAGLARFVCNPAEPGPVCNPAEPGPRGNGAP
ncbi:MAG: ATP-binding protein, partial [Acidobacteriota bacterium]